MFENFDILDIIIFVCVIVLIAIVICCFIHFRKSSPAVVEPKEKYVKKFSSSGSVSRLSFVNQWFRVLGGIVG